MSRASRAAALAGLALLALAAGCAPAKDHEPGVPALELSTSTLAFAAASGGASPALQIVTVTNGGTGALGTPSCTVASPGAPWLACLVTGTEAPYHLLVAPSVAGLAPGPYAASLQVTSPGAGAARSVAVTFAVGPAQPAALTLSGASLSFTNVVEGGAAPPAQTIVASNTGTGHLAMPAASVTYPGASGWLTVGVTGFDAPYTVSARPVLAGLTPGTYSATVSVASAGAASSPRTFTVSLEVIPKPALGLSRSAVSFSARPGGPATASQVVTVSNTRAPPVGALGTPTATVSYAGAGGWLAATVSGTAAPYDVTLRATPGALAPGLHHATVTIDAPNTATAPQLVDVTLDLRFAYTVFVYGNADSDRSTSLLAALAQMNQAALGPDLAVVVAADWSHGRTAPGGALFPAGTEWYRVVGNGAPAQRVGTAAEENLDDPAVLASSLSAVLGAYPADRYGLVLWGRGGGSAGLGGDEQDTPADGSDDGAGMTAAQAAGAISSAFVAAGVTGTRPLDFLGVDASLMAGSEVAWALRDVAQVLLADAELELGAGWDYAAALGWLAAHPSDPPAAFAAAEVAAWETRHAAAGPADAGLRAHVAIDLAKVDAYAAAWDVLSAAMKASSTLSWAEVARAELAAAPGYGSSFDAPFGAPELRDAGQLLGRLAAVTSDPAVAAAAQQARTALSAAVLAASKGALRPTAQLGVSVEAPLARAWAARRAAYVGLGWNAASRWADALDALAAPGASDSVAPIVTTTVANGTDPSAGAPARLTVSSADLDVAEARVWIAETVAGADVLHGLLGVAAISPGGSYDFAWAGGLPTLGDGTAEGDVTLLPWIGGASPVHVVPGLLQDASGAIAAWAIADTASGLVTSLLVARDGRAAAVGLADLRGLGFQPLVWNATARSWAAGTALTIPDVAGATLTIGSRLAAPGAHALVAEVSDLWGNVRTVADPITVVTPF